MLTAQHMVWRIVSSTTTLAHHLCRRLKVSYDTLVIGMSGLLRSAKSTVGMRLNAASDPVRPRNCAMTLNSFSRLQVKARQYPTLVARYSPSNIVWNLEGNVPTLIAFDNCTSLLCRVFPSGAYSRFFFTLGQKDPWLYIQYRWSCSFPAPMVRRSRRCAFSMCSHR